MFNWSPCTCGDLRLVSVPQPLEDLGEEISDGVQHLVVVELEGHLQVKS